MGLRLYVYAFLAASGISAFSQNPRLSPEEVHVSSAPYIPVGRFRSEARLVEVEAVVRHATGEPVTNLTRNDFVVYDEDKRQQLKGFSVDIYNASATGATASGATRMSSTPEAQKDHTDIPIEYQPGARSIALFFDDINSPPGDLGHAKIAAQRFVRELLATGDRVGVSAASSGKVLELTSDVSAILAAIAKLESHPRLWLAGSCPRITPYQAYQILQNDQPAFRAALEEACQCAGGNPLGCVGLDRVVLAQAEEIWEHARGVSLLTLQAIGDAVASLRDQPGKRVMLLASSGFVSGSTEREQDAIINQAIRAGIVVNALDARGLYAEPPGRPLSEPTRALPRMPLETLVYEARTLGERLDSEDAAMARLAESTGGLFFHNNNDFDFGFYEIGAVPKVAYRLAFIPAQDGKYHRIKVKLAAKSHDFIQFRPGYFAPPKVVAQQPSAADLVDREVNANEVMNAFPVQSRITTEPGCNISCRVSVGLRVLDSGSCISEPAGQKSPAADVRGRAFRSARRLCCRQTGRNESRPQACELR